MTEKISLISTFINVLLALAKAIGGFLSGSIALLAEAIHSGLDILSSAVTYFGIRVAKKPADKEHPYGYYNAETISSFMVAILLFISAIWIIYEGVIRLFGDKGEVFSLLGLIIIAISALVNEIMARVKFTFGNRENSLPLISDAEHSRADVWASIAVFVGLIATKFYPLADGIVAIMIGIYIMYETYQLGQEITNNFLDIRDKGTEVKIKNLFKDKGVAVSEIKTRKIGGNVSAEVKISLSKNLDLEQAEKKIKELENISKKSINELKYITITFEVKGESYSQKTTFGKFGRKFVSQRFGHGRIDEIRENISKLKEKNQEKILIPLNKKGDIADDFGSNYYLLINYDKKDNKIISKEKIKNQFFEKDAKRGGRFVKSVGATKIFTKDIGSGAKENFHRFGIQIELIDKNIDLDNLINKITGGGD